MDAFDRDALEALVPIDVPTRPRAIAVLDGVVAGRIWTDDAADPSWVIVIETGDGTVYGGGDLSADAVLTAFTDVETASGDLVIGFSGPHDPIRRLVPPDPYLVSGAVDFTSRVPPADQAEVLARPAPDGLRLVELDAELLPRTEWYADTIHSFGSAEGWTRRGVGRCLLERREVVAQGMAGPRVRGLMEMGVWTRGSHRRHGYGALVSLHTAAACEAGGDAVWWNTSADNLPSIRIARAIGFRSERPYELVAYRTDTMQQPRAIQVQAFDVTPAV